MEIKIRYKKKRRLRLAAPLFQKSKKEREMREQIC